MGLPHVSFSSELPQVADIVIVGGGAAGIATAYALARLGYTENHRVVVVEKGFLGYGSSTRNASRFRVHFFSEENTRFAIKSRSRILELPKITGVNPVITLGGYLWLFKTEEAFNAFKKFNEKLWKPHGVPVQFMDIDEAKTRFKRINLEGFVGVAYGPQNGGIHHDYMILAMASYAMRRGVRIALYRKVNDILVEAGRVKGVRIEGHGTVSASTVIVAAGIWTRTLLEKLGIKLPLKPVRKSLLVTEPYKYFLREFVTVFESGSYVAQTLKGEIIATEKYPQGEPETFDVSGVSVKWVIATMKFIRRLLGDIGVGVMRVWSGHYNVTPDHSHIVGRDEEWPEGLYVSTGFSGHGLMMAPYAGELLARYVVEGKMPRDLEPFQPTRFKEGKLIRESLIIG